MRAVIQKWYDWLQQATSAENEELAQVHSDGRQLWERAYELEIRH